MWDVVTSLTLVVLVMLAAAALLMTLASRSRTKALEILGFVCGAVAIFGVGVTIALYGMAFLNAPQPLSASNQEALVYGASRMLLVFFLPVIGWTLGTLARAGINRAVTA
jgi:hypothetical protein